MRRSCQIGPFRPVHESVRVMKLSGAHLLSGVAAACPLAAPLPSAGVVSFLTRPLVWMAVLDWDTLITLSPIFCSQAKPPKSKSFLGLQ
jgi:hypothetical protein